MIRHEKESWRLNDRNDRVDTRAASYHDSHTLSRLLAIFLSVGIQ